PNVGKSSIHGVLSRPLASGNGEGNSAVVTNWLYSLIIGAAGVGLLILLANQIGYTQTWVGPVRNNAYYISIVFAVLVGIAALIEAFFKHGRITGTQISVYEDGVKGMSVPAKFPWTLTSYSAMSEFQLGFNQIMSVDVLNENCVVIHVVGASHKCYCLKPNEIRDAIIKQMNDVKYQSAARPNECGCGHINPEGMKFCGKCGSPL
ncbi:MAG: zinc ribbon domain-containing protein, partial [Clostridiales bacterium]|nr:zinc ribbon domain-containing protein [Clostridiales bacterium]